MIKNLNSRQQKLTDEQLAVINSPPGYRGCLAGPGSGKSTMILEMALRMYHKHNVLILTFSHREASELNQKLRDATGWNPKDENPITIRTLHSLCWHILFDNTDFCEKVRGIEFDTTIADMISSYKPFETFKSAQLGNIAAYLTFCVAWGEEPSAEEFGEQLDFAELWKSIFDYSERKKLSFDLLVKEVISLNKQDPSFLKRIGRHWGLVIVDEAQDLTFAETEIAAGLCSNTLLVGDLDQHVYSFKYSDYEWGKGSFESRPIYNLTHSFRCSQVILDLAAKILSKKPMVSNSKTKECSITNKQQFRTEELEIEFILEKVRDLVEVKNVPLKNIAVLFRIYNHREFVERVCEGLVILGLPYNTKSSLYKKFSHLNMLFDLLELLVAGWGPNKSTINFLKTHLALTTDKATELSVVPLPCEDEDLNCHLVQILEQLQSLLLRTAQTHFVSDLFDDIVDLLRDLDPVQGTRLAKIISLIDFFNPTITKLRSDLGRSYIRPYDEAGEIFIGSIHSAKGKEWEFVFLPQLNEGILPHYKSIQDFKTDEERRVLYVGITRAQRDCYISCSQQDLKGRQLFESSFIE